MKLAYALSFLLLTQFAFAREIKLATITSDIDSDVTTFFLETTPEGNVDALRYLTVTAAGRITEDFHFSYEEVMAGNVVLEERNGYQVVKLNVEKFTRELGGTVRLNYLFNGVTNSWRELRLQLVREGKTFVLKDLNGRTVNHMFFRGHWIRVVGLVGIRDIITSSDIDQSK